MGRWIALFSHTGTEVAQLAGILGVTPDLVLTDGSYGGRRVGATRALEGDRALINRYLQDTLTADDLVTLHGYMGIIPAKVLATGATFVNGHPALITKYPELKGKDPQDTLWKVRGMYSSLGCVLHTVTEGIDEGPVLQAVEVPWPEDMRDDDDREDYDELLRFLSLRLWIAYFIKRGWSACKIS